MANWLSKFLGKFFSDTTAESKSIPLEHVEPEAPVEESDPSMKYLIVGLGNIGPEYMYTRHNVGFEVLDHLAAKHKATWKTETLGDVTRIKHRGRTYVLLKPSTFMNRSGKATRYWLEKEKLPKGRQVDFVLGRWSDEESSLLPPVLAKAGEACLAFGAIGLSQTMNKYNG